MKNIKQYILEDQIEDCEEEITTIVDSLIKDNKWSNKLKQIISGLNDFHSSNGKLAQDFLDDITNLLTNSYSIHMLEDKSGIDLVKMRLERNLIN